jgi:hypothetical protein
MTLNDTRGDSKLQIKLAISKPQNNRLVTPCSKPPGPRHRHNHPEHRETETSSCILFAPEKPRRRGFGSRAKWTRRGGRVCVEGRWWYLIRQSLFRARCHRLGQCWGFLLPDSNFPLLPFLDHTPKFISAILRQFLTIYSVYISSHLDYHPSLNSTSRNGAVRTSEGRPAQDGAAVSWDWASFAQYDPVLMNMI